MYQPKTGARCTCKPGVQRNNCPNCEGTGEVIDFRKIRQRYEASRNYEPYSRDRKWMDREGGPCRHCLHTFHQHYNGRCPIDQ